MNLDKLFAWGLIAVVAIGIFGGFLRKDSEWLGELSFDIPSSWEQVGSSGGEAKSLDFFRSSGDGGRVHLRSSTLPGRIRVNEGELWNIQSGIESGLQADPEVLGYRVDRVEVCESGDLAAFRIESSLLTGEGTFDQLQYIIEGTGGHVFTFSAPSSSQENLDLAAGEIIDTIGKNPYARYMGLLPIILIASFVGFYRLLCGNRSGF